MGFSQTIKEFVTDQPLTKFGLALRANCIFGVNAVNKSNTLTNGNLIYNRKKTWAELKGQFLGKNDRLRIVPVRYVNSNNS